MAGESQRVASKWLMATRIAGRFLTAGWANLKPNDRVKVYHGTRLMWVRSLINGFDANKIVKRDYQPRGYRHPGLFVSPKFDTARRFGSGVVLEIETPAKHLHGTDYSGRIKRKQHQTEEWGWEGDKAHREYPDSFRPGLSMTLLQKTEPQAILRGLVKPNQVKRVWHENKWYSRKEFLAAGFEQHDPYGPNKPIKELGYDLSSPNYTFDEFFEVMAAVMGGKRRGGVERLRDNIVRLHQRDPQRGRNYIENTMGKLGFGPTAIRSFLKKLDEHMESLAVV